MTKTLLLLVLIITAFIQNIFSQANAGPDQVICDDQTYMQANDPTPNSGIWTVLSGSGTFENASLYNTLVTDIAGGPNEYRWEVTVGVDVYNDDLVVTNNLYDANASVAGPTTICVDSADLLGNIPASGTIGEWSIWAGGGTFADPFDPTTRVNNLLRGSNIVRWTVTKNGCSNYDDVTITNNMVEAFAGSDIITCGNDAFLIANELYPTETGLWSVLSGSGTILTPFDNETIVTDLGAGVNVFRWSVSGNGCTAQDEVQVSENSFVTTAGFDQTVCDSSVALQAQDPSPGHGIWSTVHSEVTIVIPSSNTTIVTGLQDNTAYTFRWTVYKNGCSAWDEVLITNDLVQAYAGPDQIICESNAFLEADEPVAGLGNWTILSGSGVIVEPNLYNSEVTNLGLGINILNWTVTNQTCWTDDIVIITRHDATDATATDQVNCDGISTLDGNVPGSGESGIWEILSGSGILSNPTMYNSMISDVDLESESLLSWTVSNENCSNFIEITVTNHGFEINAGPDTTINSEQYQLQGDDPAPGNGLWTVLSGSGIFTNLTLYNTFVSSYSEGENIFSWTVFRNGCTDDDEVVITYDPVNINTISNLKINIFPNPTEGKVKLRTSIELYDAVVELTSSSGRQVYYKLIQKDSKTIELDLSHLAKGIYFVKIKLSDQIKLLKLVKK